MQFDAKQIAAPANWQDFEALCLKLFRLQWRAENAQRYGRSGQPQAGTDIYGTPAAFPDQWWGIQCKGKDAVLNAKVTLKGLKAEVEKAKTFNPKIKSWTLATTGPKDARIEEQARLITQQHRKQGLFEVQVLAWDDLKSLIAGHPPLVDEFYEGQGSIASEVRDRLTKIEDAVRGSPALTQRLLDEVRSGSANAKAVMPLRGVISDVAASANHSDISIQAQIDIARDFLAIYQPATALKILKSAQDKFWAESSGIGRFRLLTNRAAALAHYHAGDADTARRMLDDLLKKAPGNNDAFALRTLVAADEQERESPFWLVPYPETAPWNVRFAIAKCFRHRGRLDHSVDSYRLAHQANPTNELLPVWWTHSSS